MKVRSVHYAEISRNSLTWLSTSLRTFPCLASIEPQMKSRGLSPLHRPRRRAAARLFLQGRNWPLPLLPPPALADTPPPVAGPGQPPDVAPLPPPGLLQPRRLGGLQGRRLLPPPPRRGSQRSVLRLPRRAETRGPAAASCHPSSLPPSPTPPIPTLGRLGAPKK